MRTRCFCLLILLVSLLPAAGAYAVVDEVVVYPSSALVRETLQARVMEDGSGDILATFTLPSSASPDTAVIDVPQGFSLIDVHWERTAVQNMEEVSRLRDKLEALQSERRTRLAELRAVEAEIQFWESRSKATGELAQNADGLAQSIRTQSRAAYQARFELEETIAELDEEIRELEQDIKDMTGPGDKPWQAVMSLEGVGTDQIQVECSYILQGAGWTPMYRLEGLPRDKTIQFAWYAEVWQSSGESWTGASLSLATVQPGRSLQPPVLPDWIIRAQPQYDARRADEQMEMLAQAPRAEDKAGAVREERATYNLWNLGQRTIPAGKRIKTLVTRESWEADFLHLLRPGRTEASFVQAEVQLPEAVQLPNGPASFFLEGALLGKRTLSLSGTEFTLYFGNDPLVTAEEILLEKQAGSKGLFGGSQTFLWDFRVEVTNAHSYPVQARIEEALPQVRNEAIEVEVSTDPDFAGSENDRSFWNSSIPAESMVPFSYRVQLQAPEDMELDLGWRR